MGDFLAKSVRPGLVAFGLLLASVILICCGLIYDELDRQQQLYIRGKVASLAARLETLPAGESRLKLQDILQREEPTLRRLGLYDRRVDPPPVPEEEEIRPYRALVPYQTARGVSIAEFELARSEVDTIADTSRQLALAAAISGVLVFVLALYGFWGAGRLAEAAAHRRWETIRAALAPEDARALAILAEPPQPKPVEIQSAELFARLNEACGGKLVNESETVPLRTDPDLLVDALRRLAAPGSSVSFQPGQIAISPAAGPHGLNAAAAGKLIGSLDGTLDLAPGSAKITLPV